MCNSCARSCLVEEILATPRHYNPSEEAVTLYSDSTTALVYAKDPKYHGKSKHIEIKYHFIRDMVAQGEVVMKHSSTGSMVADLLTKPIARDVF